MLIPDEVPWDGRALKDIGVIAIQEYIDFLILRVHHRENTISLFSSVALQATTRIYK